MTKVNFIPVFWTKWALMTWWHRKWTESFNKYGKYGIEILIEGETSLTLCKVESGRKYYMKVLCTLAIRTLCTCAKRGENGLTVIDFDGQLEEWQVRHACTVKLCLLRSTFDWPLVIFFLLCFLFTTSVCVCVSFFSIAPKHEHGAWFLSCQKYYNIRFNFTSRWTDLQSDIGERGKFLLIQCIHYFFRPQLLYRKEKQNLASSLSTQTCSSLY